MTSRKASGSSELARVEDGLGRVADRANRTTFTTVLGIGVIIGAVAGAAAAKRSQSDDDVISGRVSIDLLKKVELLTIRLHLHRA